MNIDRLIESLPALSAAERGTMRERAAQWVQAGAAAQGEAGRRLLTAIDRLEVQEADDLLVHVRGLPQERRIIEAFSAQPMSEVERRLVQVLLDHPGRTSAELTRELGWRAQAWHLHFGTMCRERRHRLWPASPSEETGSDFYSGILAQYDSTTAGFSMRPEAVTAFAALGLLAHRDPGPAGAG